MRVWMIDTSPSNKEDLFWKAGASSRVQRKFTGKLLVSSEEFEGLEPRRPLKKDVFRFDRGVLALSDKAHSCLADLLAPCAQSVRIVVAGQVVWIENVLAVLDCLGGTTEEDAVFYSDGSKYIRQILLYDFVPEAIGRMSLFKLSTRKYGPCYCTDAFVRRVVEYGLEGFRFVLVWDSNLPLGTIRFEVSMRPPDYFLDSGKKGKASLPKGSEESYGLRLVSPPEGAQTGNGLCTPENQPAAPSGDPIAPAAMPTAPANRKPASYDGPLLDADIRAARASALASLPDLPALGGALSDGPCAPLGSRVGGEPAMLPGEEWPLGPGGGPLCFLAQLDMADLAPLPGFPRRGLLRLFVGPEPEYGLDPGDMAAQRGFRALFAPDASGARLRPAPSEEAEDGLAWGEGPWAVRFGAAAPMPPDDYDFRVQGAFSREWAGVHPDLPAGGTEDADLYASEPSLTLGLAMEAHRAAGDPPAVQVGGYPRFVQVSDPRGWEERYEKYDALLFQLSSDPDRWINIGDGGRMHFFIPSANLAAGDFSDVMYWWDCM